MVPTADLPAEAILRDGAGRALFWRSGKLIAPRPATTLTSLLAGGPDELRTRFEAGVGEELDPSSLTCTAPVDGQEVWGAGITYRRSRDARAEESGRQAMYDHVYSAPRPEIFYKGAGRAVVGWGGDVAIRSDSAWHVPEPELAVLADAAGTAVAYSIGNDVTARGIEAENPLYLPQAKIFDGSCAIGPAAVPVWAVDPGEITITVERSGERVFSGAVSPAAMVRDAGDLVRQVVSWHSCAQGLWLLTGTGIVPPDDFTLLAGDHVIIAIEGLGTLRNDVAVTGPDPT